MLTVVADISASESAKRVYLIAGFLVVVGIALLVLTIWFWRTTRPEHVSLAPLEVMGDRGFVKLDEQTRLRKLNDVRTGAPSGVAAATEIDLAASAREEPVGFDDLRDEDVASESPADDDLRDAQNAADDDTLATVAPTTSAIDPLIAQAELDSAASGGDRG